MIWERCKSKLNLKLLDVYFAGGGYSIKWVHLQWSSTKNMVGIITCGSGKGVGSYSSCLPICVIQLVIGRCFKRLSSSLQVESPSSFYTLARLPLFTLFRCLLHFHFAWEDFFSLFANDATYS